MKTSLDIVLRAVESFQDTILAAERHIWKNPESGYKEWKTHAYLKAKYEELGYTVTEAGNIPGFWMDVDTGRPGPRIAVFGEMDSLIVPTHPECDPETGAVHACGHHCQSAALLGVAAALKAPGALDNLSGSIRLIVVPAEELIELGYRKQLKEQGVIRYFGGKQEFMARGVLDNLSGSIRLIVVPAEELIELGYRKQLKEQGVIRYFGGKQEFMARGVLDNVDIAIMVHTDNEPGLFCGSGSNGCIIKEATFMGKSSHAGGSPHRGVNALYAANCGMQAANCVRETFPDADHIRFHPIITKGGDAVNAIPDRVVTESFLRASSLEAMSRENLKVNRAFAGGAAAMGAQVRLWDHHGYAPLTQDHNLKELFRQVGAEILGEDQMHFTNRWGAGSTDMGDVSCVMPALHPSIGGATGLEHSKEYFITDPVMACVDSAKMQAVVLVRLLENEGAEAKRILAEGRQDYPTIPEYLAQIDALCMDKQAVVYDEGRGAWLTF